MVRNGDECAIAIWRAMGDPHYGRDFPHHRRGRRLREPSVNPGQFPAGDSYHSHHAEIHLFRVRSPEADRIRVSAYGYGHGNSCGYGNGDPATDRNSDPATDSPPVDADDADNDGGTARNDQVGNRNGPGRALADLVAGACRECRVHP